MLLLSSSIIVYGVAFALKFPLPYIHDGINRHDFNEQNRLIASWENVRIYNAYEQPETVEEIVEAAPEPKTDTSQEEFLQRFNIIEREGLKEYINNNGDVLKNGYSRLLIDKVDVDNTPTGIKTIHGDDVLAIDAYDGIVIVGLVIGGNKGKLAIIENPELVGLSVVDDLKYWDDVDIHAERENAILAINASGYIWNNTANYGVLYGAAIRNGNVIRKYRVLEDMIGFTEDNKLVLGANMESYYNACEFYPHLIKDGEIVYKVNEGDEEERAARTAIGQTEDGSILMLIVDGNNNGSGATLSEVLNVMKTYGAVNAANLSGGKQTIMWWNGRIVNVPYYDPIGGVRLPTAWVVRPKTE